MAAALPGGMQTTTTESRLDTLLRRIKHRSAYDLALPAIALVGVAMIAASIMGA